VDVDVNVNVSSTIDVVVDESRARSCRTSEIAFTHVEPT
jgi:hypothetical protein